MLSDPDGLQIQLVEAPGTELFVSPSDPRLQAEASIRGLHGVVLSIDESPGALGERLQLPASLEAEREHWEAGLGALPL